MKKFNFVYILCFVYQIALCQYITPGTGIVWGLDDLEENSGGVVTYVEGIYYIHEDLIISEADTIRISTNETLFVDSEKLITVNGVFDAQAPQELYISATDTTQNYLGFRFNDTDESVLRNCIIEFGGGIELLNSDMLIDSCIIRKNNTINSAGAIDLFYSNPEISHCEIYLNEGPAVLSSANAESSPFIYGNYIYHNNTSNSNMPQINLGTSDPDNEIKIIENHIEGYYDMVGGIAITTLAGGSIECLIQGNTIINNRYGITQYGFDISSVIENNFILNNNIQNIPLQGGSGINFWGDISNISIVSNNTITGNLWGITNTGNALPNLGQIEDDLVNDGKNHIYNNGNGGITYDLYNNTPNNIYAENNYWGTFDPDTVELNIFHQADDPSLGYVDYLPIKDYITSNKKLNIANQFDNLIYPNPARDRIFLNLPEEILLSNYVKIEIISYSGECVLSVGNYRNNVGLDLYGLSHGSYLLRITVKQHVYCTKFIKH